MKKRIAKWLLAVAVIYGALWGLTVAFGESLIEKHLASDLQKEWRAWRDKTESREDRRPHARDSMAFDDGPSLKVRTVSFPAPFICIAAVDRKIGGLNGRGAIGKYLLTPWRTYILSEHDTWIS